MLGLLSHWHQALLLSRRHTAFHPRITSLSPQTLSIHSQHVEGEHGAGGCEKIVRHPCAWHL